MAKWQESKTIKIETQWRRAAEALKLCPLCGAVNAMSNEECFVCSWHCAFDHDPEHVEEGLDELLFQCPELAEAMMDVPRRKATRWERATQVIQRIFGRLLPRRRYR